jgi:hypothetical protein
MIITLYPHARTATPAMAEDMTWPEFVDTITVEAQREAPALADPQEAKKMMLSWSPVRLAPGRGRSNAAVEAVTALALDVDAGDPDAVVAALEAKGWAGLIYESPRSTPEAPRFRVVSPVAHDIPPEICATTRQAYAEAIGLGPDVGIEECLEPARVMFIGKLAGDPDRRVWHVPGAPVDLATLDAPRLAWGAAAKPRVDLAPIAALPPGDLGIATALGDWREHDGRKWHVCGALGGAMRRASYTRAQCEATVREWLAGAEAEGVNVHAAVARACAAWDKAPSEVSGPEALAEWLGAEHGHVVAEAISAGSVAGRLAAMTRDRFRPVALDTGVGPLGPILGVADPDEPIAYLCEGLRLAPSDGKISLIAGMPGTGKGPLADYLAICLATGSAAFGRFACRASKVLILDVEGARLTRRRIRRMARAMRIDPHVLAETLTIHNASDVDFKDDATFEALERAKPDVVIVDSYTSAMLTTGVDFDKPEFATLARILGRMNILVLAVAHARKLPLGVDRPTLNDVAGSFALAAMAASAINVYRPDDTKPETVRVGCMRAPETGFSSFDVTFTNIAGDGLAVSIVDGLTKDEADRLLRVESYTDAASRVLWFMREANRPVTQNEIKAGAGLGQPRVSGAVASLHAAGIVRLLPGSAKQYVLANDVPFDIDAAGRVTPRPDLPRPALGFRRPVEPNQSREG